MRKINNRKSLILAAGGGKYVPNIKECEVYHGYLPGRAGTVARQR